MRALVVGDTGGIGSAVSARLRARGAQVVGLSRQRDGLDVADPAQAEAVLDALDGPFGLIFVATGALVCTRSAPEKSLREVSAEEMAAQFAVNTIGPALVLKQAPRLLARRERGAFAALAARVGSAGENSAVGLAS